MKLFDLSKPFKTRNGHSVRILCTDRQSPTMPIVGLVTKNDGFEEMVAWGRDGRYYSGKFRLEDHPLDLVHAPKIITRYVNQVEIENSKIVFLAYDTRHAANSAASCCQTERYGKRLSCQKITFTEGQFDD